MTSWQAHAIDAFIRLRYKRRLGRLAGAEALARARAILAGGPLRVPAGPVYRDDALGGVGGEWVSAPGPERRPALLYLHGGGYFTGSPKSHRPVTASLANAGFHVFAPHYRLAPEHPYPAAVDDAEAVWDGLLAAGASARGTVLAGDSAGGGLALALMIRLRDKGKPLPAAAALFSPWTDLAGTGESLRSNARREAIFGAVGVRAAAAWYLGGAEPRLPEASPYYAALKGLPPLMVEVGERELLRDDSTRLALRAAEAGVGVALEIWPVVPHGWQLACAFLPEARRSLARAATFLRDRAEALDPFGRGLMPATGRRAGRAGAPIG